jgi:Transaldolase/Fructose-6-phosphate aldolase
VKFTLLKIHMITYFCSFNLKMVVQVKKAYNYIHKYNLKTKVMAAAVRNKQDLFSLLGYNYSKFGCLFKWMDEEYN